MASGIFASLSIENLAVNAALFGILFSVTLVHFILEPVRWNRCYLPPTRALSSKIAVRDAMLCTAFATYILPFKLGIPLRIILLRRGRELTLKTLGTLMTLDAVISIAIWIVFAMASASLSAARWSPPTYVWIAAACCAVVASIGIGVCYICSVPWFLRIRIALNSITHLPKKLACGGMLVSFDVCCYALRHALLLLLVTGNPQNMISGATAGVVATFAGIISGLPMGLVGYDATLVALLSVAGVSPQKALIVVVINRALNLVSAAVLGIPAAIRMSIGRNLKSVLNKIKEIGYEANRE